MLLMPKKFDIVKYKIPSRIAVSLNVVSIDDTMGTSPRCDNYIIYVIKLYNIESLRFIGWH